MDASDQPASSSFRRLAAGASPESIGPHRSWKNGCRILAFASPVAGTRSYDHWPRVLSVFKPPCPKLIFGVS